jgi:hypothetical protein
MQNLSFLPILDKFEIARHILAKIPKTKFHALLQKGTADRSHEANSRFL